MTTRKRILAKHKIVWSFVAMVAVSALVIGMLTFVIASNRKLARDGKQAHDAICTLKEDYEHRIINATEWLRQNPNGAPGIPRSMVVNSIAQQQLTLRSLEVVQCDEGDVTTTALGSSWLAASVSTADDQGSAGTTCKWRPYSDLWGTPPWWYWWDSTYGWGGPCVGG